MKTIPRGKATPRERTATPAELEEDRRRCLAAKPYRFATVDEFERFAEAEEPTRETIEAERAESEGDDDAKPASPDGNLCACLVTFAAWRACSVCGSLTLYVNENVQTDSDFECGLCEEVREILARWLRPSLPMRVALHLLGLFSTANDNRKVAHAS
jgi:hypothetical protein